MIVTDQVLPSWTAHMCICVLQYVIFPITCILATKSSFLIIKHLYENLLWGDLVIADEETGTPLYTSYLLDLE